jgi:hypothetical protein
MYRKEEIAIFLHDNNYRNRTNTWMTMVRFQSFCTMRIRRTKGQCKGGSCVACNSDWSMIKGIL